MSLTVIRTGALDWQDVPDSLPGNMTADDAPVHFKHFLSSMPSAPAGQLMRYAAGHTQASHRHEEDEIFVILEGDMSIESSDVVNVEPLGPGSLAFISSNTWYSQRTESGCLYLRISLAVAAA
jgi:mannose-6-phosphate isomerase-like protein (cupin superfamily)